MLEDILYINTLNSDSRKNLQTVGDALNYYKDIVDQRVTGWFYPLDIIVFFSLLREAQKQLQITGDLCELGVAFGKSAVGLSLFKEHDDNLYLYDLFAAEITPEMAMKAIKDYGTDNGVEMRVCDLMKLTPTEIQFDCLLRFLHIDACHYHTAVVNDLTQFSRFVHPQGVIAVDDINDPEYPGINSAITEFCLKNPEWKMFAIGQNKAYLTRESNVKFYTKFLIRYMRERLNYQQLTLSEVMGVDVLLLQARGAMSAEQMDTYLNDTYVRAYL